MRTITDPTLDPDFLKQAGESYEKDKAHLRTARNSKPSADAAAEEDAAIFAAMERFAVEDRGLRDKFAMAALTGLVSEYVRGDDCHIENIAEAAYQYADAMMKARAEK